MSLDGIWIFEVVGVYGWERVSTAFMEKGRFLSGSASAFSYGTYVADGNKVKIKLQVTQHGKKRTIFGEKHRRFSIVMKAKCDGDKIEGKASLKGAKSTATHYSFRLLRKLDLPAFPQEAV